MIKNQFFKEKLIQTNILKNKKIHAFVQYQEEDDRNQSIPTHNKINTYDVDLMNTRYCKLEEKPVNSLSYISFTNIKDCEQQPLFLRDMVDKVDVNDINEIYLNQTLST